MTSVSLIVLLPIAPASDLRFSLSTLLPSSFTKAQASHALKQSIAQVEAVPPLVSRLGRVIHNGE